MRSLLLHMHQPDYRHPRTGEPTMPWVRLHATRGYRDVPRLVAETGAQVTVNLVPSLLDQLDHYRSGGHDLHLRLAAKPAEALSSPEADFILAHFFHGHPALFDWFPAYGRLRARFRGGLERPSVAALRDIQVWSNLAWFGATALREWPLLAELRNKGGDYGEEEKSAVLAIQRAIIHELPGLYAAVPEISASPYYHPILPLLVDTSHAARNLGPGPYPRFTAPDDAFVQLRRGRERVEAWTGRAVAGLWPSEGSVSPEVAELAHAAGFSWMATDQGILERSDHAPGDHRRAWAFGPMRMLFRDRGLSDRIGFLYASWDGAAAARDVTDRAGDRPILLALDGENPWESYRDAGLSLMRALFSQPGRTCGEFAADRPAPIARLHTGSWIGADFRIWIGDHEDRIAWRHLAEVRETWEARGRPDAAHESILRAEGSDWTWWFGPEFDTPFAMEFDTLFRAHLVAAWEAMGGPVPEALHHPIKRSVGAISAPSGELGTDDDWFGWGRAGIVELRLASMATISPRRVEFGDRDGRLVARLVPEVAGWTIQLRGRELVVSGPDGVRFPPVGAIRLPAAPVHPSGL